MSIPAESSRALVVREVPRPPAPAARTAALDPRPSRTAAVLAAMGGSVAALGATAALVLSFGPAVLELAPSGAVLGAAATVQQADALPPL